MKTNFLATFLFAAISAVAQYKADAVASTPAGLSAPLQKMLSAQGVKIVDDKGKTHCEVWLRAEAPAPGKSTEENVTLPEVPHGALLGLISFPGDTEDRRGQKVKAGLYTLRYSNFPINGDHQGVAPQRDFFVLTKAADDPDPTTTPKFDELIAMSRKASGTPHPLVMSIWKSDAATGGFAKEGEHDWVLQKNIGKLPFSIILIGKGEG